MKTMIALSAIALMSIAAPAFADRADDHKYGNPTDRNWKANNAARTQSRHDRMNQDSMHNSVPDNHQAYRAPTGL